MRRLAVPAPHVGALCFAPDGRLFISTARARLSADALQAYEAAFKAGDGVIDDSELSSLLFGIWTTQLMAMDLGKARGTV